MDWEQGAEAFSKQRQKHRNLFLTVLVTYFASHSPCTLANRALMNLDSLRGTKKEVWEHVAASRMRPDEDWQEVFQTEKEDAEPAWYCSGIWKPPTVGNEQVAELADGHGFIFLTWKGTLLWVSHHCRAPTKCILAVHLLPLVPDSVHFATTNIAPGMCDPWPSSCCWLFHLMCPLMLQKTSPELLRSKQITCKAGATQQHIGSCIFSILPDGCGSILSSEVAGLKVLASNRGRTQQQRRSLGKFWVLPGVPTLQSLPWGNLISIAEKAFQGRGPWGLQLDRWTHMSGLI